MPGRKIIKFTKNLITILFIKFWRLKTECIQIYIRRTAPAGFIFSGLQKTLPVFVAPKFFLYKQQVDIKPIPIGFANQPPHNFLIGCAKNKTQWLMAGITRLLYVVMMDAPTDNIPNRIIGLIYRDDIAFFIQRISLKPFQNRIQFAKRQAVPSGHWILFKVCFNALC